MAKKKPTAPPPTKNEAVRAEIIELVRNSVARTRKATPAESHATGCWGSNCGLSRAAARKRSCWPAERRSSIARERSGTTSPIWPTPRHSKDLSGCWGICWRGAGNRGKSPPLSRRRRGPSSRFSTATLRLPCGISSITIGNSRPPWSACKRHWQRRRTFWPKRRHNPKDQEHETYDTPFFSCWPPLPSSRRIRWKKATHLRTVPPQPWDHLRIGTPARAARPQIDRNRKKRRTQATARCAA